MNSFTLLPDVLKSGETLGEIDFLLTVSALFILVDFQNVDNDSTECIVAIVEGHSERGLVKHMCCWKTENVRLELRNLK